MCDMRPASSLILAIWLYYISPYVIQLSAFKRHHDVDTIEMFVDIVMQFDRIKIPVLKLPHTADTWLFQADSFINRVSIIVGNSQYFTLSDLVFEYAIGC